MKICVYISLFLLCIPYVSWSQSNNSLSHICFIENSEIIILGTSNVTDYQCKLFDLSNNTHIQISSTVFDHTIKLHNAIVLLKSKGFDCENKMMTSDFYHTIKGESHPTISVNFLQFTLVDAIENHPIQEQIPAKIAIQLAGITNYYSLLLSNLSVRSDELTVTGSVDLLMTDFDISPPTALFGAVKTADEIVIEFKITFRFK